MSAIPYASLSSLALGTRGVDACSHRAKVGPGAGYCNITAIAVTYWLASMGVSDEQNSDRIGRPALLLGRAAGRGA